MINVSRVLLRQIRMAFSRGLGINAKKTGPPLMIEADHEGVTFQTRGEDIAIQYFHASEQERVSFAAPFELLRRYEGNRKRENVTIQCDGDSITVEWHDGSMPQAAGFDCAVADEIPLPSPEYSSNPPALLDALCEAARTAKVDSARYALTHILLRGDGQIAATDGKQLLIQSGFTFPWDGEILIPANKLLKSGDLACDLSVEVSQAEDWFVLKVGPWTVWLKVLKDGRFPKVDSIIPNESSANAKLHLSDSDADFLSNAIEKLPGNDEFNSPATVDLNGSVAIRGKSAGDKTPTEIVLSGSRREGEAVRFSTDRRYLARAARLGFRSFDVIDADTPVYAREPRRTYMWAVLSKAGVINSDPSATRVESPTATTTTISPTSPKPVNPMTKTPNHVAGGEPGNNAGTDSIGVDALIASAEEVRSALRESNSQVSRLIADLKQHRKQTKSLQAALSSIRALQPVSG